ncbi:MAG: hypothetical protein ABI383_04380, partial [Acidobacteriaceae bacterium]
LFSRNASVKNAASAANAASELPKSMTLAVLPIEAPASDPKLAAFEDGLLNVLTAKLTRLTDEHPLQVISANDR